jgi:hypothetical protein
VSARVRLGVAVPALGAVSFGPSGLMIRRDPALSVGGQSRAGASVPGPGIVVT